MARLGSTAASKSHALGRSARHTLQLPGSLSRLLDSLEAEKNYSTINWDASTKQGGELNSGRGTSAAGSERGHPAISTEIKFTAAPTSVKIET